MGNQCCGKQPIRDLGEMAFASAIPVHLTKKLDNESSRLYQVMVSKTEQQEKNYLNSDRTEEFILTLRPYSPLESPDSITIEMKIKTHDFSYKNDVEHRIDEDVIIDPNCFQNSIMRAFDKKTGEKSSIRVINFDDYDDYKFKAALYEIYILQQIQKNAENNDFIASLKDAYILESEDKDHHKGSVIIFMEYCDSTLHEIIAFRNFHEWRWTENEVSSIFADLTIALTQLEQLNITHRDIRPHNIWYSVQDQRYKIAGFQDAKIVKRSLINNNMAQLGLQSIGIKPSEQDGEDMLNTIRGVPDFLPPEVSVYAETQQQVGKYNPFLQDVYQLGLCITMCKFLANHFENHDIRDFINKCKSYKGRDRGQLGTNRSYIDILKMMLASDEKSRLSTAELGIFTKSLNLSKIQVKKYKQLKQVNEDNLIKSMKFKKKIQNIDTIRVYQLVAIAYFDLFEWDKWEQKMQEIYVTYENSKDERNQAQVLFDIAEGFLEINSPHNAQDYFMRSSILLNEIGHQDRKDGQNDDAIKNYSMALDCIRKAHNGEDSYEGALMLENLGNVFRLKGDNKKARSYLEESARIIQQEKGEESLETAKVLINLGKIYTLLADYKLALKKIKKAIKIIDNYQAANNNQNSLILSSSIITGGVSPQTQSQILKASALSALGELQRLKGRLEKARVLLEEALAIRQNLQGTGHIDVASTLENLGNVFFEMEDYHSAKTFYEQALVIKKSKLGEINTEIALTLNNIGNACKHLGEQDKAQKFFTDALQILQQTQGNEEHQLTGVTYGNLGVLLKEQGNHKGAEHCLVKCTNIIQKSLDPDHPDHQFYLEHLAQVQSR